MRIAKTRPILQIEFVECGAAALGIILDYHGRHESPSRLRDLCKVSRDGSSAEAILNAAREFGLDARAFSCDVDALRRLPPPYIVFWNFDHFVVVEGFAGKRVHLNDPAAGRTSVSLEEFDRSFTGVALAFGKTDQFRKGGSRPSTARSLFRRLKGQRASLLFVALASLALIAPSIVMAALPKILFDSILARGAAHWIRPLVIAMAVMAAALAVLTRLQRRALIQVECNLAVSAAGEFFWRLLRLPMTFYAHRHTGDLVSALTANDRVAGLLAGEVATNVVSALLAGAYLTLMFRYDKSLAAVVAVVAALNVLALRLVARRRAQDSQRIAKERNRLYGAAMSGVGSIETLKACGSEDAFFNSWVGQHAEVLAAEQNMQRSHIFLGALAPLLTAIGAAVVLGIGGLRIMDGWLTLGMLVAFQTLMSSFLDPFNRLLGMGSQIQQVQGDLSRLDDVLDNPEEHPIVPSPARPGEIELRNVTFGYSPDEPLIRNFNLTVRAGTRVALVGASGCGKSTILKLLAGLYRPQSGEACVGGSVAMVDQDIHLIEGTIAENIALLDETIPQEVVVRAAQEAALHEPLSKLAKNLSFGQRQRVDLARALATNPQILILDEATSALDPITEMEVLENLRGRTCVMAAHRLSAIRDCDEIIVIENGEIAERGTHESLLNLNRKYCEFIAVNELNFLPISA